MGYSKQAYYKQRQHQQQSAFDEYLIVGLIRRKREIWKRGSGRNLLKSLEKEFESHGIEIGRDKFFDILRRNRLLKTLRRRKVTTTDSYHRYHKYPNLIKEKIPRKAHEIWVSDITYLWLRDKTGFCYLFLITDLYSRKIIGYCVSKTLEAKGAIASLSMAMKGIAPDRLENCIHHSDRGIQYCCDQYIASLLDKKLLISMTENSDPLENAVAERINKTIKEEFTDEKELSFKDFNEARKEIKKFIDFYNNRRPHRSISWLTPGAAYLMEGELKRQWKNYDRRKKKGSFAEA
ncbi:MAG TPA: IS3 family transposase [Ginsengibacter sp.]